MIFIEFLFKHFKPRYYGNGQQKIGVPIGFFPFWVKANTLRTFHENLWLGVSNDSRWLQRIGIKSGDRNSGDTILLIEFDFSFIFFSTTFLYTLLPITVKQNDFLWPFQNTFPVVFSLYPV